MAGMILWDVWLVDQRSRSENDPSGTVIPHQMPIEVEAATEEEAEAKALVEWTATYGEDASPPTRIDIHPAPRRR